MRSILCTVSNSKFDLPGFSGIFEVTGKVVQSTKRYVDLHIQSPSKTRIAGSEPQPDHTKKSAFPFTESLSEWPQILSEFPSSTPKPPLLLQLLDPTAVHSGKIVMILNNN